jgi:prepilin-type N-terminal cleavage/methylation domain-containing protein
MRERGFTLVELLTVLLLLGVIAAVVVPELSGGMRSGAAVAAREVEATYRLARDASAERGVPVTVTLELATGAYVVRTAAGDEVERGAVTRRSGVRLAGGRDGWVVARFSPLGRARAERLVVADDEESYDVTVHPWTATIEAQRR